MKFKDAANLLSDTPYTSTGKGKILYDLVMQNNIKSVLELGFAHGCSSCYFAAALEETGGQLVSVDLETSLDFKPTIEETSKKLGFKNLIEVHREKSSYTWFLRNQIAQSSKDGICEPKYDLIFIDGPKDWTNDGAAFFMADKLLKSNGLILFDDYNWTYRSDEQARGKKHEMGYIFKDMSESEFESPQVKDIFDLLVCQHPNYSDFKVIDDLLALARKSDGTNKKTFSLETRVSPAYQIKKILKGILKR